MSCSGHDKWDPQFVEKLLPLIQKDDLVLVYPQAREIKIDGTLGGVYQEDYTTTEIEKPADRYLYVLKNIGMCNAVYSIWETRSLKKCCLKPVIALDVLILLSAALLGKFKQYSHPLFLRRTVREEYNDDMYPRQFRTITGKNSQKTPRTFFLKGQFIFENIKMLYQIESKLSPLSKLNLSIQTIYVWVKKLYVRLFLINILKKILPQKFYLFLENKLKDKIKKYL